MVRKDEPKSKGADKLDHSKIKPWLGVGMETDQAITAEEFERHVDAAAAELGDGLASLKDGEMQARNYGYASTLHGLWIKDGSKTVYQSNIQTFQDLASIVGRQHENGMRPIDLMGSGRFFEPWSVVFTPRGDTGYYWQVTSSDREFDAKNNELFHAGFRIVSLNRRHGNFNATWVWKGDVGEQPIVWDIDWFSLKVRTKQLRDRGFRISTIDRYGTAGSLYCATWERGEGEQILEAAGGLNTYFGEPAKLIIHKYERDGLEVRAMGHNGHAAVVYRPKVGNYHQEWTYNSVPQFASYNASCDQDGYRLTFLSHATWQTG